MDKKLVSLTDRQIAYVSRQAKRLQVSFAEVVRRILDAHISDPRAKLVIIIGLVLFGAQAEAQEVNPGRTLRNATFVFAGAASADWLSTRAMLKRGGTEDNPMLHWAQSKPDAMIAVGASADAIGVWALNKTLGKRRPKLAAALLYAASAGRVYLTVRNMRAQPNARQPWGYPLPDPIRSTRGQGARRF